LSGLFLAAYTLPALLIGWFIGPLTKRFGKKRTAFSGMLIGSLILSFFSFSPGPVFTILIVFSASLFISCSLPAINSAYADYISEASVVEGEVEGLEDFSFNIGYVLGPVCAGILADYTGIDYAFSLLGFCGVVLLLTTPKSINIRPNRKEL
jgi:MFS family permease